MNLDDAKALYKNNYSPDQVKVIWDYYVEKFKNKH